MSVAVRDVGSNQPEHLVALAAILSKSEARRKVFAAIYHHRAKARSVAWIMARTKLSRPEVLRHGRCLDHRGFVEQVSKGGDVAYARIKEYYALKDRALRLAVNPRARAKVKTKRDHSSSTTKQVVKVSVQGAKATPLTIDDIDTFMRVKGFAGDDRLPRTLSEKRFREGVQRIIGEPGRFVDWPGERSDLYTSRLVVAGKRRQAAIAFKGPGVPGKMYLNNLGKRGNQIPRLFDENAEVFLVQHWREIESDVLRAMEVYARMKSLAAGRRIYYGVIDGKDSSRILHAYPQQFH